MSVSLDQYVVSFCDLKKLFSSEHQTRCAHYFCAALLVSKITHIFMQEYSHQEVDK